MLLSWLSTFHNLLMFTFHSDLQTESNRTYTTKECLALILANSAQERGDSDTEWRGDDIEIEAVDFQEENNGTSATNSGEENEDVSIYDDIDQTWIPPFREKTGVSVDTIHLSP